MNTCPSGKSNRNHEVSLEGKLIKVKYSIYDGVVMSRGTSL